MRYENIIERCKPTLLHNQPSFSSFSIFRRKERIIPRYSPFLPEAIDDMPTFNKSRLLYFKEGDEVEITLKMDGIPQCTGHLPVLKGYKRSVIDYLLRRKGERIFEYDYISRYKRDTPLIRLHEDFFRGKLKKGEAVYYTIVGYVNENQPIRDITYCCKPGESKAFVYRMTHTADNGCRTEYTPSHIQHRCVEMGVPMVPLIDRKILTKEDIENETAIELAEKHKEGPDIIDPTHQRAGIMIRLVNNINFLAFDYSASVKKNFVL